MVVFAQLSTSVSDDQIRLIILALLAVALMLALLTTWYAVKTSPRRRVKEAQARREARTARPTPGTDTGQASTVGPASAAAPDPSSAVPDPAGHLDDDDDEWTRLTAPQQQHRSSS